MSEFKGTPGPWIAKANNCYFEIKSELGGIGDACMSGHEFDSGNCLGPTAEANANLIAAAPELLEALDKITKEYIFTRGQLNDDVEGDLVDVLCIKNARAAIAKALGR
jgi:hypothetical protein